ncbi:hypothetical protein [Actinomadura sp. 3N508]|uniref:hypothetical protein n=1 Tax=Actinomadura sp. 3N508 TaxID=3375153 RepID=UPI0037B1F0DA
MIASIAATVTAVGVFLAVVGLRQSQRQRIRVFEDFYVKRYWDIMDHFSLDILYGRATSPLSENDGKAIFAYLLLCEDELDLRESGWISDATWRIWADGMRTQLGRSPFKDIWQEIANRLEQQPAEEPVPIQTFDQLRVFMSSNGADPLGQGHWWQRRVRGLRGWLNE